jgi:hypothetical protein
LIGIANTTTIIAVITNIIIIYVSLVGIVDFGTFVFRVDDSIIIDIFIASITQSITISVFLSAVGYRTAVIWFAARSISGGTTHGQLVVRDTI